jgi:predicted O-linked N-acetylglucosamine transferase (SPINDLY family)
MMAAYAAIDIALDTHPFSGATTTCEALWMGLPVITLAGDRPAGRQSEGILRTLGRVDWVVSDADDFVRIARDCAADADGRSAWRNASRERMAATTLADGAAYAAGLASVLRRLAR